MTNTRKLEILWQLYFIAVGLDTLMAKEEIMDSDITTYPLPFGFCYLMRMMDFDEVIEIDILGYLNKFRTTRQFDHFHHPEADWHIRSKALLKAIKKVSKDIKQ